MLKPARHEQLQDSVVKYGVLQRGATWAASLGPSGSPKCLGMGPRAACTTSGSSSGQWGLGRGNSQSMMSHQEPPGGLRPAAGGMIVVEGTQAVHCEKTQQVATGCR